MYTNVDWADNTEIQKSTSGYIAILAEYLVFWLLRKQTTMAQSSTEAEYIVALKDSKK